MNLERVAEVAETPDEEVLDLGELDVADYIVFLFSVDTYSRYLAELGKPADNVLAAGLSLLRTVERQSLDRIGLFIRDNLPSASSLKVLDAALRQPPTEKGASVRALKIRTVLSRGGPTTVRSIFGSSNKARREVQEAIEAAMLADADAALAKLSLLVLRNKRLERWIDAASEAAVPQSLPLIAPAQEAAKVAADQTSSLIQDRMQRDASNAGDELGVAAEKDATNKVADIQQTATEAAKKALNKVGEEDTPVTKSEAMGIAAATAAAVVSSKLPNNLPPSLAPISDDPEKMAAVRANGRVLLAAGAGSGKTQLLVSRLAYLVQERNVNPSRIFTCAFNRKAAQEIKDRVTMVLGDETVGKMMQGKTNWTMHAIFRGFIIKYGTPQQKAALTTWFMGKKEKDEGGGYTANRGPTPGTLSGFMIRIWRECFGNDPPKGAGSFAKWQMNDISPAQAKAEAIGVEEEDLATWYEWTLGFKGEIPNWQPPCVGRNRKATTQWGNFLQKWRDGGRARLGDFTDQIIMFRDLLRDNPQARKEIQGLYDHICVDEAQDLNKVQHEIIANLSGHIGDGSDGKSLWLVGDEIQSINAFIGAKPELFTQFHGQTDQKTGAAWKTLNIGTNYRCLPEILAAANRLMTVHPRNIPMETRPYAGKPKNEASIIVDRPEDNAAGAIETIARIKQEIEVGDAPASNFGVLARTNKELNDYETACIISGVPYGRKGGGSFLQAFETQTTLAYLDLITGTDYASGQESFGKILDKPNRLFLGRRAEEVVERAYDDLARRRGMNRKDVPPLALLEPDGIDILLRAANKAGTWSERDDRAVLAELAAALKSIKRTFDQSQDGSAPINQPPYTTQSLLDDIMSIPGKPNTDGSPRVVRDDIMPVVATQSDEETEAEQADLDDEKQKKPIGNVAFLYMMAQPNPMQTDLDPSNPKQFKAYLDKLQAKGKDLRIDIKKWDKEQRETVPDPKGRKPAPCVVLSTVHSMKGAQFKDCTVVMAGNKFPMPPFRLVEEKDGSLTPEEETRLAARRAADFLVERQLAYVALTRAERNLTIISPRYMMTAMGPMPITPSVFIEEAGLHSGQNVAGQPEPQPLVMEAPVAEEGVRTASSLRATAFHYLFASQDFGAEENVEGSTEESTESPARQVEGSYDRRDS